MCVCVFVSVCVSQCVSALTVMPCRPEVLTQTLSCPAAMPQMAASATGTMPLWSAVFMVSIYDCHDILMETVAVVTVQVRPPSGRVCVCVWAYLCR